MRKLILSVALMLAATAGAVKVQPGPFTVTQPDGTQLTLRAFGDQDLSYFLTSDGTLVCQEGTSYYVASVASDGTVAPSRLLAHEPRLRTEAERTVAKAQDRTAFFASLERQRQANHVRREPVEQNTTLLPSLGNQRVAVILVEFSDSTFKVSNPRATFDKYLNGTELFTAEADPEMGNNYGSVARYFSDMSFGKFTPQFDVMGPVKLPHPLKHYGEGNSSYERMDSLLHDACAAVDDTVDFAQYDANADGYIDLVYVIYAGYSQSVSGNSTDCIWPKSGVTSVNRKFDGKSVRRYGVNNELNFNPTYHPERGPQLNGIGLFCHEFIHCMGLPDLYPSSGSTGLQLINHEMEYWSVMDAGEYTNNGYRPTAMTAWEREALGWLDIDTLDTATDVTLAALDNGGKAYRIINDNDATGQEYYILENVQKAGWNGKAFGHGMMVTHVDYNASKFGLFGAQVNSTVYHPRMFVVPADGMLVPIYYVGETIKASTNEEMKKWNEPFTTKYEGQAFTSSMYTAELAGDLYPGTSAIGQLTDESAPTASTMYTGMMSKPITDITENADDGTVSFKFKGGTPSAIANISTVAASKGKAYNLQGVRLDTPKDKLPKGIYIIDGHKTVIK